MKNKNLYNLVIIVSFLLIPVMIAIHVFVGKDSKMSHIVSGALISAVVLLFFIYILMKSKKEFKATEERLKNVLDSTAEGIYGMDLEGNCIFANKSCIEMLGYESERDLIGKNTHLLFHHSYKDGSIYPVDDCGIFKTLLNGGNHHSSEEVFWRSDGTSFDVEYRSTPKFSSGVLTGGVVTFIDITEKKKAQERINYLSYHDPVTSLYNLTFLNEEMRRLDVPRNLPFSVIIGDVNGLKLTNDIFGHEAGDNLLKEISKAIVRSCRADDIIARVGGDEFIMLLPKTTLKDAETIKDRIYSEVDRGAFNTIKGGIALGVSTKIETGENIQEIIKEAEVKMYKNKTLWLKENSIKQLESIMDNLHLSSERERLHSAVVSKVSEKIARNLNLSYEEIRRARDAGYYHDIGKIILDKDSLRNLNSLNDGQSQNRKRHPVVGYRILSLFDATMDLAIGALDHHEYFDGTGYPKGLNGEEISLLGRIISLAEYYDFKTNPHGGIGLSREEAVNEIAMLSGTKFDPAIVDAFLRVMETE